MLLTFIEKYGVTHHPGSNIPSRPHASPRPSNTARICGTEAGCRCIRPFTPSRKIAAWKFAPEVIGALNGATETDSSNLSEGDSAFASLKPNRFMLQDKRRSM